MSESTESFFLTYDNLRLYYRKDIPKEPKALVLILHGIGEHCGRYGHVTEGLLLSSIGVFRMDHRGHGKSEGKSGYVKSYTDFFKDVDILVSLIKDEYPSLPLFILGHSMGGFIAAGYGVLYGHRLRGQILSGAATKIPFRQKLKCVRFPSLLRGEVPNTFYDLIAKNQGAVESYKNDPLVLCKTTFTLNNEFGNRGTYWLQQNLSSYNCSCLILHGGEDQIVPKESSIHFYEGISSKDKKLIIYDGLYHEILNEAGFEAILREISTWIEDRVF